MTIFEFKTLSAFIRSTIEEKLKSNQRLSMRALGSHIGVSNSTLHDFYSGKRLPTTYNLFHFLEWLNLNKEEEEYFWTLSHIETIKSVRLKTQIENKRLKLIEDYKNKRDLTETLGKFEVRKTVQYISPGGQWVRYLKIMSAKNQGSPDAYVDQFVSFEKNLGGTGFILPNQDNSYRLLLQDGFGGGAANPRFVSESNRHLKVENYKNDFPIIRDFSANVLGTKRIAVGTFYCEDKEMVFIGNEEGFEDGSKKPLDLSFRSL